MASEQSKRIALEIIRLSPGAAEFLRDAIAAALDAAVAEERAACCDAIQAACGACDGKGHAGNPHEEQSFECEYCGRPIAAIRARGER